MSNLNKDQLRAIKNAAELDGLSIEDRKTLKKMIDDFLEELSQKLLKSY